MATDFTEGHEFDNAEATNAVAWMGLADGDVLLGRFRVVRRVGSGGMGDVYEAIDLLMDGSRIALKTIRPDLIADAEQMARFKNEVQLARRVSSQYVCRIHELFLTDGVSQQAFLTMEFLEGSTVADKLRLHGPLPWAEARKVALDLCEALRCIHEAGVIHRDLKGRNIMLTERNGKTCAVLMDFGIARAISQHTGNTQTALTQIGVAVGTPEYMAPEQFDGSELSEATDVYALGIVLFEMTTGEKPFSEKLITRAAEGRASSAGRGSKSASGKTRSRTRVPVKASMLQAGVPSRFDAVIAKCLEYDASRRYQSAKEVEEAIRGGVSLGAIARRPFVIAAVVLALLLVCCVLFIPTVGERMRGMVLSSSEKHVAILPFEVIDGGPEVVALGDGLMDSLAGDLANLDAANQTLWVIPASEIRARKVSNLSQAVHEFGATIVISGSFEKDAGGARLKLTLTDPKKMREIGFVSVASAGDDLATMEGDAVTRLGRLMNLSDHADSMRSGSSSGSGAAYESYLAGVGYFQRYDQPGNLERATESLQQAIRIDPKFALGFARLAQVYIMRYRIEGKGELLKQAEASCKEAAELDDRVPATYVALAQIHEFTGRQDLAIQEYQRAEGLDPRDAEAIAGLARAYASRGRNEEAEADFVRAAALRPADWNGYNDLGNFYEKAGKPKEAIAQWQRALQLAPDNSGIYSNLGMAYMDLDDARMSGAAEDALKHSIAINPTFFAYANLGFLYAAEHRFPESVDASQKALAINSQNFDAWSNLAAAYEWEKDTPRADAARSKTIALLQKALKTDAQNAEAQAMLAALWAKGGRRAQAMEGIGIALALSPDSQYVLSQVADAYEVLGDREKAILYLARAVQAGFSKQQLNEDPEIQGVLVDPRFRSSSK